MEVFDKLINVHLSESDDVLLRRIEKLNLGEVVKLCDRLRLTHPNNADCQDVLDAIDSLPSSSRASKPRQTNEISTSFSDVGGYEPIKQKLREVFLWPMQHPQVYKSVGIRIGNGAILHGPSGAGKTLIARALATEIGLNVIHIKV